MLQSAVVVCQATQTHPHYYAIELRRRESVYLDGHSSAVECKGEEATLALEALEAHSKLRLRGGGGGE